jgi:integrase/recombinase XerD
MLIYIRSAKGGKERNSLLGSNLLSDLRNYFTQYKPQNYLFEGQKVENIAHRA